MPKRMGHVYCRSGVYWIKFYSNGVPQYESSKSHKESDALRLLKRRLGEVESETYAAQSGRILVSELLDDLLRDYRANNPKSYTDFAMPVVKRLRAEFGKHRTSSITTDRLIRYQDERRQTAANATINREMALLRRAFHLGEQATPKKVHLIPRFPMLPENNVRKGFLERSQYEALLLELPAELKPLLTVGYHIGCRRGELVPLQVSQVDLAAGIIRLNPGETKNDEGRILPIYGDMIPVLAAQLAEIHERWPFCRFVFHRCGQRMQDFRESWDKAAERAGVPGLLFHDLRRSAVRNMIRAGIPERVAMAISGHKTRAMLDRYNIVSERDIREAGTRMEAYFAPSMNPGADGESRTPKGLPPLEPKSRASANSATSA